MSDMHGKTVMVVGASRGLGRGVAEAFVAACASVVAVARATGPLADLVASHGESVRAEAADASDPVAAGMLLDAHRPDVLALVAGAQPLLRPLHHHTWETFSTNWNVDVRMAFHWLREALLLPLQPGSRIIVMSSGAALQGSPLSGGYAGAKAAQRFIADYANQESQRAGLGITVRSVLPRLTAATELGRPAVAAYAARLGATEEAYLAQMGAPVTPEAAGAAFVRLATGGEGTEAGAYLLTGDGLKPL
jgi:NAD(P)-dependent dehydrogenase (short-subunit alcohol dehydrogenase family)